MAENNKTHWKKLTNPDYLGAYSLMQGDKAIELTVVIQSVRIEKVKDQNGKDGECMVARIVNNKPLIINKTNAKTITKLYDTPYIEDWQGKAITLFVAKVRVGGETVDALRIRPTKPKMNNAPELEQLTPTHEKWNSAVSAITGGNTTLEAILKKYIVSEENKALLFAPLEEIIRQHVATYGENIPEGALQQANDMLTEKRYQDYFGTLTQLKEA